MQENTVTKIHSVVQASYTMTVNEQRLLLACISQIDPRFAMPDGKTYILTIEQAKDLFYTVENAKNVYRDLGQAVEKLYERDVKIPLPNGDILQTRFVQSIIWSSDRLQIQVKFADDIKPYLTELKNNFSSYKLKNIVQLTSIYAIRLYEWLVSWAAQRQNYKELELSDFREKLEITNKYQRISELKAKVIEIAIEQINEKTDFQVSVSYKKDKREIRWIQLTFNQKPEIAAIEQKKRDERKAQAERNRAAKLKRELTEQKEAEKQQAQAEQQAREQAEQESQEREKAEQRTQKEKAVMLWENLAEEKRAIVRENVVKRVYPAYKKSVSACFDENNLAELTGRFHKEFFAELEQFRQPENEKTIKEKLTEMWKDGLITQDDFLELIEKSK